MSSIFHQMVQDLIDAECTVDRAEVERRERIALREQRLHDAHIAITPEDSVAIQHDRLDDTAALRIARKWLSVARGTAAAKDGRPMRFLALLGLPSRGKTVAAAWLLAEVGGLYVSAPELGRMRASSHWRDQEAFRSYYASRLVIVDDIGAESSPLEEALFDLVNARQVARAMTILTGNITRQQFEERYGERTTRRIEHQGVIAEVGGPDLRRGAR